jgi:hypothetical protein
MMRMRRWSSIAGSSKEVVMNATEKDIMRVAWHSPSDRVIAPDVPDEEHNAPKYLRPQAYKPPYSLSPEQQARKKETDRAWELRRKEASGA